MKDDIKFTEEEKLGAVRKALDSLGIASEAELIEVSHDASIEKLLKAHPEFFQPVLDTYRQTTGEWMLTDDAKTRPDINFDIERERDLSVFFEEDDNGKSKFIPGKLGEHIKAAYGFKTANHGETIHVYSDGVYKDNGEIIIKQACRSVLGGHANTHRIKEVLAHIQQTTYDKIEDSPDLINMRNGLFDLKKKTLSPHEKEKFMITQIPVAYDPKADCPTIMKFIGEVLNERDIPAFQEWAGYCLYPSYPFHKAVMLIGEGQNGKSTLLELLKCFAGAENVANIPLQRFEKSPFAASNLEGKMLNIFADLSDAALMNTGIFKTLTGGDAIPSEKKFVQKHGSFVNRAKLMFSCNKLPETLKDKTRAYFRRWMIWSFDNIFVGDKCDPYLIKKLTTEQELSGFFNYALGGLERLLEKGEFTNAMPPEEMEEYYQRLSSPVVAFIQDIIKVDPDLAISKDDLYQVYVHYCKAQKLPPLANNSFARELKRQGLSILETRIKTPDGKRPPAWAGLGIDDLKTIEEKLSGMSGMSVFFLYLNGFCRSKVYINIRKNIDNIDNLDTDSDNDLDLSNYIFEGGSN